MKIKPRPIIKTINIAEIVPNKYPTSAFLNSALKLPKATETVVQICARMLANLMLQEGGARGYRHFFILWYWMDGRFPVKCPRRRKVDFFMKCERL